MDTTQPLINEYLGQLDAKPKTIKTYKNALEQFVKWQKDTNNYELSRARILEYKTYLTGKYSSSTANAYLTSVKGLAGWMKDKGLIESIGKINGVKTSKFFKKDALTIEQAKQLIGVYDAHTPPENAQNTDGDAPGKDTPKNQLVLARNRAIVMTLLYTGTRAIELSRALVGDIRNMGNQTVLFVQGKGDDGKNAFVVLVPTVQKVINEYLDIRGNPKDDEPLFMSESNNDKGGNLKTNAISKIVKDGLKAIHINNPRLTCHSTRHFFATTSILQGVDILTVSRALRHKNIQNTLIYIDQLEQLEGKAVKSISMALDTPTDAPVIGASSNPIITIQGA